MLYRKFIVAARSDNANSFGLHGLILMAKSGETWEVGVNHLCLLKQRDFVQVGVGKFGRLAWEVLGFEIPRRLLTSAPQEIVDKTWPPEPLPEVDFEDAAAQVAEILGAEGARSQKTVCRPCDLCKRCDKIDACEHYPY